MNRREIIERLSAAVRHASSDGDHARARRLAALRREILGSMSREAAAAPGEALAAVPRPRPVPKQERLDWL
ncbi:MAG: hypothetical protein WBH47_07950 [Streptosporangiaceae bacterium]